MTVNKKKTTQKKTCEHVQMSGQAYYDRKQYFMFTPDDPMPAQLESFRRKGTAQQMSDGTFDFVPEPDRHSKATLIKKLAHGRASETKDGAIQLTIKVYKDEGLNIGLTILEEAVAAVDAIRRWRNN